MGEIMTLIYRNVLFIILTKNGLSNIATTWLQHSLSCLTLLLQYRFKGIIHWGQATFRTCFLAQFDCRGFKAINAGFLSVSIEGDTERPIAPRKHWARKIIRVLKNLEYPARSKNGIQPNLQTRVYLIWGLRIDYVDVVRSCESIRMFKLLSYASAHCGFINR